MATAIEWTDTVWNPVTGCSKVSEGCRNCYAFALHDMRHKAFQEGKKLPQQYAKTFNEIQLFPERLLEPMKWRKPRKVFVNSMADLFHPDVPFEFIDKVFAAMTLSPKHTFQILTKRPERMQEYMNTHDRDEAIGQTAMMLYEQFGGKGDCSLAAGLIHGPGRVTNLPGVPERPEAWPLPNVWLGTSVENQKAADERIPLLLQTPAAVRFLSCEPLLGPVDLSQYLYRGHKCAVTGLPAENLHSCGDCDPCLKSFGLPASSRVDWVIAGGESGPNARPMHPDWVRSLRDQCQAADVSFFFKQWGEWFPRDQWEYNPELILPDDDAAYSNGPSTHVFDDPNGLYPVHRVGKKKAGRLLDGREWNEFPSVI